MAQKHYVEVKPLPLAPDGLYWHVKIGSLQRVDVSLRRKGWLFDRTVSSGHHYFDIVSDARYAAAFEALMKYRVKTEGLS